MQGTRGTRGIFVVISSRFSRTVMELEFKTGVDIRHFKHAVHCKDTQNYCKAEQMKSPPRPPPPPHVLSDFVVSPPAVAEM